MRKRKMKRRGLFSGFVFILAFFLFSPIGLKGSNLSQAQEFMKTFGGVNEEWADGNIRQTSDSGYILVGATNSFGAGDRDALIIKVDGDGNIQWQKTFGGILRDSFQTAQLTDDGGYIVAGKARSFGSSDDDDAFVMKLDSNGNAEWQKTIGGIDSDEAESVQQTSDGGYIMSGRFGSVATGAADIFVIKLDASGNIQWQKTFGGNNSDAANVIQQTSDGGYIVAGETMSFGVGGKALVIKLDASGNIQWQKVFGGVNNDFEYTIQQTLDGGFILGGSTFSFGAGNYDVLLIRLDSSGNIQWQRTYGGVGEDVALSTQQTADGGYIVAGFTASFGAGNYDVLLIRLDSSGNIQWQKVFGGSSDDYAVTIQQTSEGGYILAGATYSFGAGSGDVLVLKLDSSGNIQDCSPLQDVNVSVGVPSVTTTNVNTTITDPGLPMVDFSATTNTSLLVTTTQCTALPVEIDIKPGSDSNCFNQNEHGVIPVAIFGSADFDVNDINLDSLSLQGLTVKIAGKSDKYSAHSDYIDDDEYLDLIIQFEDSDGWINTGDGDATLSGELYGGTSIVGTDTICIVP